MNRDKMLGALYGAAYGDSFGAIVEYCHHDDIKKHFPNGVKDYTESISFITKGIKLGHITDDFGSSCYIMQTILKHNGHFNRNIAIEAILEWSKDKEVFEKYAGRTTREAIKNLRKGIVINEIEREKHFIGKDTNGGAMKVSPIALLAKDDEKKAIQYTLDLCYPTHYNSSAVSGAAAITVAICVALKENATIESIISSAIKGAHIARLQLDKEGFSSFGPYIEYSIRQAVDLVKKATSLDDVIRILYEEIGTGMQVNQSIPTVFAIIYATNGNLNDALYCAIHAGGDTDTIASMVGAILGGFHGVNVIEKRHIERIIGVNKEYNIDKLIEEYIDMILE